MFFRLSSGRNVLSDEHRVIQFSLAVVDALPHLPADARVFWFGCVARERLKAGGFGVAASAEMPMPEADEESVVAE